MKKKSIITVLVLFISLSSFGRKVYFEQTITSTGPDGPCEWVIKGWIDINVVWGWPPIEVNSYNVSISGPCGSYTFIGMVAPAPDEEPPITIVEGELFNEAGDIIEYDEFPQIYEILVALEEIYNQEE